ncbi:putative receptor-like protein kinase At4g00960 [Papaver somniferum]|uniref:putative receptor-like protein kinase At4g00960 n=1 Tax=Papaver somniferum TaxID=3469 RepID=UPI000E6F96E9|nr:putative receptor-like protein kinase At4g00960 [Papaver somniferum]XP_026458358.1 putative receptor-like protein kinase At4g00960 [Papaver somniferum]
MKAGIQKHSMGSFFKVFVKILSLILICYGLQTNAVTVVFHNSCSGDPITSNTYQSNLNLLLSSLTNSFHKTIIRNGYYNHTVGRNPNTAYGMYQCRGDITLDECRHSVNSAAKEVLLRCPKIKQAIITYKELVVLKVSDQLFFSIMQDKPSYTLPNAKSITNPDEFNPQFDKLANKLVSEVASNGISSTSSSSTNKKLYANGSIEVTRSQNIYGLAQCTSDLSVSNCTQCLRGQIDDVRKLFRGRIGARVICMSCFFRYELYPLYLPDTAPSPSSSPMNPPLTNATRKISLKVLGIIVLPSVIAVLSIIVILLYFCIKTRKKAVKETDDIDEIQSAESLQFKFSIISAATQNFSDANKLGEGGFGTVYKGTLLDGQETAVKKLAKNSGQGEEEFKNEVVLLVKLQHKNLVRLLGFCLDGDEKLLVYEFMKHGSLDQFLFDPIKSTHLDWGRRYKIIGGIAKGLVYLHEDSRLNIIHRDLKAGNILLGEDMVPKIADFGMARIFMENQNQVSTKRICGTFGYMAPEYAMNGKFSVKSDVFSFGVLILEILCGRKSSSFGKEDDAETILSYAWELWKEGKYHEFLDPILRESYSTNEVVRCIQIGLLCVQEDVDDRPTMAMIIHMLNNHSVTLPSPLSPSAFLLRDERRGPNIPAKEADNVSVNEVTVTELYPR